MADLTADLSPEINILWQNLDLSEKNWTVAGIALNYSISDGQYDYIYWAVTNEEYVYVVLYFVLYMYLHDLIYTIGLQKSIGKTWFILKLVVKYIIFPARYLILRVMEVLSTMNRSKYSEILLSTLKLVIM